TYSMIIDEVRIYRENLSADAVAAHWSDRSYVADPPAPASRTVHWGPARGASLNVADFQSEESFTCGIEEAIAALPREGGEVYLPPGRYLLRRSIWVPGGVTLRGAGAATILMRPPQVQTEVTAAAAAGDRRIQVKDPSGFEVGADVSVYADGVHGWHSTTAHIAAIEGDTIVLERGLNKPVDPAKNAGVINYFPMITAEHKRDITVRDLTIDGGAGRPNRGVMDFTWAALHFYDCVDITIEGCRVRNYVCDGISVQAGRGAAVTDCLIENCRGHGMHPGTGLQDSVWSGNISRDNVLDGLFFCMRVRHAVVSNNVLVNNEGCGIGHLGGGGDKYNVVSNNTCIGNGRWGIHVYDGTDNVVTGNLCLNNSRSQAGRYPGIGVIKTTDTVISGNRCLDDQETKTQAAGVVESEESDHNLITGNSCRGNLGPGVQISGPATEAYGNMQ
ncbi:MAG: right-handed parallel beta-helix repeat-containing protein, partial [Armatimonadetes bacterium]|nr:right-handed parallel beta-helix repeat-containing protein [Armatimonadota bacterium]